MSNDQYEGKTSLRLAFEQIPVNPEGKWSKTLKAINRSLRRGRGTYKTRGWRKLGGKNGRK